jgi:hypothetical protein
MRSFTPGKAMPYALCSVSFQPAPIPITKRPPLSRSSWAAIRPTSTGERKVTGDTSGPKRMRCVSRAATAKERYASSESCCRPMKKWSERKTVGKPSRSASCRMWIQRSQVRPFCPSIIRPTFILAST